MNYLKKFRLAGDYTQKELADAAGMSRCDIARLEAGHARPYAGWRTKLAAALNVPADQLFPEAPEDLKNEY